MTALLNKSRFLCFLLRHKPQAAKLTIDPQGWCRVDQLLANTNITEAELLQIVAEDDKQRYSFDTFATSIRANQGHSTPQVDLEFKAAMPPPVLYHGTSLSNYRAIMEDGLVSMSRHYVHLSADPETAFSVAGRRRNSTVVFEIDAATMAMNGYTFFISENGVWLIDNVPPFFIKEYKCPVS